MKLANAMMGFGPEAWLVDIARRWLMSVLLLLLPLPPASPPPVAPPARGPGSVGLTDSPLLLPCPQPRMPSAIRLEKPNVFTSSVLHSYICCTRHGSLSQHR